MAFGLVPAPQRLPLCACGKRRENHIQSARTAILKGSLSQFNNEDMEHQFCGKPFCMNTASVFQSRRGTNVTPLHSCSVHSVHMLSLCLLVFLLQTAGRRPEGKSLEGTNI